MMTKDQNERLVVGFERIAEALEGLNEEIRRAGKRYWPTPGPQREVVITRVPTEEDKINERQGNNIPIEQWLKNLPEPEDDEFIGERTRQWRKDHPKEKTKNPVASTETVSAGEQNPASVEEVEGKA